MGKGVPVEVATVDPSSPRFMLVDEGAEAAVKKALEAELARAVAEGGGAGADAGAEGEEGGAEGAGVQRASL